MQAMINLKSIKIGDTVVPRGLFLAPMAGFTDLEFREICRECGAEFTVTEMISAKAVCFSDKKTKELAVIGDKATSLQLFGHDPRDIETACRILLGDSDGDTAGDNPSPADAVPPFTQGRLSGEAMSINVPSDSNQPKVAHDRGGTLVRSFEAPDEACRYLAAGIDLNMGCPVKKIVTSGDGSALMRDSDLCRRLVEAAVRGSGGVPVTVKIRAGFDSDRKNAAEVAMACVNGGASAVFVHGRTREQFYAPSSDNAVIAAVRDALPPEIPVIGNGDIVTVEDADRMLRETGCDGIMIGRAALGDPWLFGRIAAAAEGIVLAEPAVDDRLRMAMRLCEAVCRRYGETRGVPMCRGRAGHFIRGIRGGAAMRDKLCHAVTLADISSIFGSGSPDGQLSALL